MKRDEVKTVDYLLRDILLDLSLETNNKELFLKMTSRDWKDHIVGEENVILPPLETPSMYLEKEFYEEVYGSKIAWERYLDETTIADTFEKKKARLLELKRVCKNLNKNLFQLVDSLLKDEDLINLLIITCDKAFRNGVFFMDEETNQVSLKDKRKSMQEKDIEGAIEHFKNNKEAFFLEISIPLYNNERENDSKSKKDAK